MVVLSDEQAMLKDMAAEWARDRAPLAAARRVHEGAFALSYDPDLYAEMAQMGWTGMLASEAHGGSGFGYVGMGVVAEALGRNLTASPLLASALTAAVALEMGGTQAQKDAWLPGIVSGERIGALAVDETPRHDPSSITTSALRIEGGWRLNGVKRPVAEGMAADLLIVAARTSGEARDIAGLTLFLVDSRAAGVDRQALRQIDARGSAVCAFCDVDLPADAVLGEVDNGWALLERILDRARAGLAAEMLGAATQAFETTLDYLKTRVQFGQVIGAFQALQHRAAVLFGEIELTRSAVMAALAALDSDSADAPRLVSLAKSLAGDTLRLAANEMIQLHGGIGMTDEHDAGLYLKRARAADVAYGGSAYHRERWGRLSGY